MKLKYSASVALVLWLGVVAWVSAMIVVKPSVDRSYAEGDGSGAITQLQSNISRNRQLLAALDGLTDNDGYITDSLAVTPGEAAPASAGAAIGETNELGVAPVTHRLSLILTSDRGRRALIDGQWTSLGSLLADGSRVRVIGPSHVLLEESTGQRLELRMPAPFTDAADAGMTEVLR